MLCTCLSPLGASHTASRALTMTWLTCSTGRGAEVWWRGG
jgi:hypothetical protein